MVRLLGSGQGAHGDGVRKSVEDVHASSIL